MRNITRICSHKLPDIYLPGQAQHSRTVTIKKFYNFAASKERLLTHGVIGNTSDFGSEESWFEPRWVNKKAASRGFFVGLGHRAKG